MPFPRKVFEFLPGVYWLNADFVPIVQVGGRLTGGGSFLDTGRAEEVDNGVGRARGRRLGGD